MKTELELLYLETSHYGILWVWVEFKGSSLKYNTVFDKRNWIHVAKNYQ